MISSQRLIIMLIAINMMIGYAMQIYYDPTGFSLEQTKIDAQNLEQKEVVISDEDHWYDKAWRGFTTTVDNSIGNVLRWGWTILKIFVKGINPLSFSASDFDHPIEQSIANILITFRSIMMTAVVGLGVYLLYKNKATQ